MFGLFDQTVVGGASFAATLLVGGTNSAVLGEYSIATVIATVLAVQNMLVLLPFTIRLNGTETDAPADERG